MRPRILKVGDRVVVTDRSHPHHGEAGNIIPNESDALANLRLDWTVQNDMGARFCVASREVQKL